MPVKWEPWKEIREIVGCSARQARTIIKAGRKALPYPRTKSTAFVGEQYGSDLAVIAALRARHTMEENG